MAYAGLQEVAVVEAIVEAGEEADEVARALIAAHAGTAVGEGGTKSHVVVGELVGREVEVVHPKMLVGVGHVAVAAK